MLGATEEAAARSGTYRLLARLWLREIDRDLVRELRSPPLCDAFVAAGGIVPAGDDDRTIEQLAIDYCRLFVGPTGHLPPYQSVWRNGQFKSATSDSMERFVEVVNYETDVLPGGMMLDHLGVQLDVMGHILDHFTAWQSELGSRDLLPELARTFFARHLLWTTDLLAAAARRAETEFYRATILLTRDFLNSEQQA